MQELQLGILVILVILVILLIRHGRRITSQKRSVSMTPESADKNRTEV